MKSDNEQESSVKQLYVGASWNLCFVERVINQLTQCLTCKPTMKRVNKTITTLQESVQGGMYRVYGYKYPYTKYLLP